MRQGAQQLLAANLGPERFREGALIRRARVPPGPEPPPDNAVCHSPNPGPRARGGLTIGKRWTERDRRRRLGRRYERSIDPAAAAAAAERVVVCTALHCSRRRGRRAAPVGACLTARRGRQTHLAVQPGHHRPLRRHSLRLVPERVTATPPVVYSYVR
jgi:hypothetical protein